MTSSRSLLLLKAIDDFEASSESSDKKSYEFEVFAETSLEGELRYGPFSLLAWDPHDVPVGTRRSLVFSFAVRGSDVGDPIGKRKAFYHGVDLPTEFCVIASTLLRRRLTLGPLLRVGTRPLRQPPSSPSNISEDTISAEALSEWLDRLRQLPNEDQQVLVLAARMYHEALSLLDSKPDVSYLLLVSCIEVFVGRRGRRKARGDLGSEVVAALDSCANDDAAKVLERRLLELDRGIGKFFVEFIMEHTTDGFWGGSQASHSGQVRKDELERLLKRIYGQRSKTLHEGQPFPPNIFSPDGIQEIDRREEFTIGEKRWTKNDYIPYVSFFERLVHHVVVEFLRRQVASP